MTYTATTRRDQYTATGVETSFPYTFRVDSVSEIRMRVNGTITAFSSITNIGASGGGSVILAASLTVDDEVIIEGITPLSQNVSYQSYQTFPAAVHELAMDRRGMVDQELKDEIDRKIGLPDDDSRSINLNIPVHDETTPTYLVLDINGNVTGATTQLTDTTPLTVGVIQSMLPALAYSYPTRAAAEAGTVDTGTANNIYVGALAYVYDASGTALTTGDARTWSPAGEPWAEHFGVVADGVTDDTLAFQAALDWCEGKMLRFSGTVYVTDTLLVYSYSGLRGTLMSKQYGGESLIITNNFAKAVIQGDDTLTTRAYGVVLEDFGIDHQDENTAGTVCIDMGNISNARVRNLQLERAETAILNGGPVIRADGTLYNVYDSLWIDGCKVGINSQGIANSTTVINCRINDCDIGTIEEASSSNTYFNNAIESVTPGAIAHQGGKVSTCQYTRYWATRSEGCEIAFDLGSATAQSASTSIFAPQCYGDGGDLYPYDGIHADSLATLHVWGDDVHVINGGVSTYKVMASDTDYFSYSLIAAGSFEDSTLISVTGMTTTDHVILTMASDADDSIIFRALPEAGGFKIRASNPSAAGVTPGVTSYTYLAIKTQDFPQVP